MRSMGTKKILISGMAEKHYNNRNVHFRQSATSGASSNLTINVYLDETKE